METLPESNWFPPKPSMNTEHGSILEYLYVDKGKTEEYLLWQEDEEIEINKF